MKIIVTGFVDTLSKRQRIAGLIYIPMHMFIIPLLVAMLGVYYPGGLSELSQNLIYYGFGLAFCMIVMFRYLRRAFDILLDNIAKNIFALLSSYFSYWLLAILTSTVLLWIMGDDFINPNNEAVVDLAQMSRNATLGLAVFIAPIVEEILFRGVLFGSIRKKSRVLAYVISIGLFAFYHVWQFALMEMDWKQLIFMIQYIPAGYALALGYERTNCIWIPIFLHMGLNVFSMLALTA